MSDYKDIIADSYNKILLIDLQNDIFTPLKVEKDDKVEYRGMNQWFIEFATSEQIYPADKKRFLDFANVNTFKERLKHKKSISINYQKYINSEPRWFRMEIMKTDDDNILLLIIKDINESWMNIEELKYRGKFKTREKITEYIDELNNYGGSCGIIMLEYEISDKAVLNKEFNNCFSELFEYDDTHAVAIISGYDAKGFQKLLANIYSNFTKYNINIGVAWREDEWSAVEMVAAAVMNLQVNRKK